MAVGAAVHESAYVESRSVVGDGTRVGPGCWIESGRDDRRATSSRAERAPRLRLTRRRRRLDRRERPPRRGCGRRGRRPGRPSTPGSPTASSCSATDAGRRGRTSGLRLGSAGLGLRRVRRGLDLVGLDLVDRLLDDGVGLVERLADLDRARVGDQREEAGVPGRRSRPGAPRSAPCGASARAPCPSPHRPRPGPRRCR